MQSQSESLPATGGMQGLQELGAIPRYTPRCVASLRSVTYPTLARVWRCLSAVTWLVLKGCDFRTRAAEAYVVSARGSRAGQLELRTYQGLFTRSTSLRYVGVDQYSLRPPNDHG